MQHSQQCGMLAKGCESFSVLRAQKRVIRGRPVAKKNPWVLLKNYAHSFDTKRYRGNSLCNHCGSNSIYVCVCMFRDDPLRLGESQRMLPCVQDDHTLRGLLPHSHCQASPTSASSLSASPVPQQNVIAGAHGCLAAAEPVASNMP